MIIKIIKYFDLLNELIVIPEIILNDIYYQVVRPCYS